MRLSFDKCQLTVFFNRELSSSQWSSSEYTRKSTPFVLPYLKQNRISEIIQKILKRNTATNFLMQPRYTAKSSSSSKNKFDLDRVMCFHFCWYTTAVQGMLLCKGTGILPMSCIQLPACKQELTLQYQVFYRKL